MMIKVYIPNIAKTVIGGAFTFLGNFRKGTEGKIEIVDKWQDCDICFIVASPLMDVKEFDEIKKAGKKIVLRVDGIPEDWRNQGLGWSSLKHFAECPDVVIYQSQFTRNTIGRLLRREGTVIYNGVDQSVFHSKDRKYGFGNPSLLYVHYRDDPNKRLDEVITRFREYKTRNPAAGLTFVGNYPNHLKEYNFGMLDLERDKDWRYMGIIQEGKKMADIMRSSQSIAFPSFADPCPNTLIEAASCGCIPLWLNDYGGQREIVDNWEKIDWSLERMCKEYYKLFKELL